MQRATPLQREAFFAAGAAGVLASALAWLGPPGSDLAAHAYQRALFIQHGFTLWNNFWYAGRYGFVTYSVLYYPLAALFGIRLLAVATIATAALAFAFVLGREWGPTARWSSRTFAVVWAGLVLSAAFPFALGMALALLAIWALQAGGRWRFRGLALATLLASPVAFLLLAVLLLGVALARRFVFWPVAAVLLAGGLELVLWRLFPGGGRFPFSIEEFSAAIVFCTAGAVLTWRVDSVLRFIFLAYGAACVGVFTVPSAIGENVARLRFAAIPLAVLVFSLRAWRPRVVALGVLSLAVSWNVTPLVASYAKGSSDPASEQAYWSPAVAFLHAHLSPSFRVEAVDTVGHWSAVYLPRAGIPLARGWYRQDDFPLNNALYGDLGRRAYTHWLRGLGIRYVVLTSAPDDYSARDEAALLRSGRSGLRVVLGTPHLTVFEVPNAKPIVSGHAAVLSLTESRIVLVVAEPGHYRVAIRWSPYWRVAGACATEGADGMLRLHAVHPGYVSLAFGVGADTALDTFAGLTPDCDP